MPEALFFDARPAPPALDTSTIPFKGTIHKQSAAPVPRIPDIIDIRSTLVEMNLKDEIFSMFNPAEGPRKLPTLLLYNERGLQLFEDITYLEEYYLTNYEIELLQRHARDMVDRIPSGSMVIELGSGNLRKVCLLLQALEDAGKDVEYYALDLSRKELERTLAQVPQFKHVVCRGLLGTYDDGREWLKQPELVDRSKCILSLGSSIGNFERGDAAEFLKGFVDILGPSDTMLIGVDACGNPEKVYHAYNDSQGLTHRFILNGLTHANEILGHQAFDEDHWKVIGEYVYDESGGRHQAFYSPLHDTRVVGSLVRAHERVQVEQSLKYSYTGSQKLWEAAGLSQIGHWSRGDEYGLHLLEKRNMSFSLLPSLYVRSSLPSIDDWESLWGAWDDLTRKMIPDEELLEKPIKLRNACIFYLGHIPTFLDIQLTKTTGDPPTEPGRVFWDIFERGIDPDVDNPELCHAHSEIPDEWPALGDIIAYQERVRRRIRALYKDPRSRVSRSVRRGVWLGFEHEAMHFETLLYMMLQSEKTRPPPLAPKPDFEALAEKARAGRVPNEWHDVPEQTFTIGMEDPEDELDPDRHFGWDNERPPREVNVHAFQAMGRPITNEEYAGYLYANQLDKVPASWAEVGEKPPATQASANGAATNGLSGSGWLANGDAEGRVHTPPLVPGAFVEALAVRTVYGLVPLRLALDWPVFASYDELSGCAEWMGGRVPTLEEARSIYAYAEHLKRDEAERTLGKTVPAVNGHLVNDGVEESPHSSSSTLVDGESSSGDLFIDLDGANVGLQHWHPTPVTGAGGRLSGQAEMGGVWEWTSSPLTRFEGFKPMALYPGYTADFFDGKHNIVLGGSWATHPRIAGRKSFVNWYQRNYLYAWTGARLVRDKP